MDKALEVQREISSGPFARIGEFFGRFCYVIFGKRQGNYLLVVYLFTKLLFIGNVVCQLFLLNKFLGNKYNLYGLELLMNVLNANLNVSGTSLHGMVSGAVGSNIVNNGAPGLSPSPTPAQIYTEVVESPRFPRVTMCHFQVSPNNNSPH